MLETVEGLPEGCPGGRQAEQSRQETGYQSIFPSGSKRKIQAAVYGRVGP